MCTLHIMGQFQLEANQPGFVLLLLQYLHLHLLPLLFPQLFLLLSLSFLKGRETDSDTSYH